MLGPRCLPWREGVFPTITSVLFEDPWSMKLNSSSRACLVPSSLCIENSPSADSSIESPHIAITMPLPQYQDLTRWFFSKQDRSRWRHSISLMYPTAPTRWMGRSWCSWRKTIVQLVKMKWKRLASMLLVFKIDQIVFTIRHAQIYLPVHIFHDNTISSKYP